MSPTLELQGAIVARLKAASGLTAIIGSRVYDHVPRGANEVITADFPFVAIGVADEIQDDADCIEAVETTIEIEAWSRSVGYPEVSRIADVIRSALHKANVELAVNGLVELNHRQTRRLRDADGLTSRAICEFVATIEIN